GGSDSAGSLSITVAAPHYETDGETVNTGFYNARIPNSVLRAWGINPGQVTATYKGESVAESDLTVERKKGAILVSMPVTYSSGTVTVSGSQDSSDTTAPTLSNVALGSDGAGNLTFTVDSDEQLGAATNDVSVRVDGPTANDVYTFDRDDFVQSGSGPYTYTLDSTQAYDNGEGTYTATIDTATDSAGNDGGGSDLTASHDHTVEGSTPEFVSTGTLSRLEDQDGPLIDLNATDGQGGLFDDGVTYTITGGADASSFTVDSDTGVLLFGDSADFETPADADGDNTYEVDVTAATTSANTTQPITVTFYSDTDGDGLADDNTAVGVPTDDDDDNDGILDADDPEPKVAQMSSVSGTITDVTGSPVTSGTVTIVSSDGSHRQSVSLDNTGDYTTTVPAGSYRLVVDNTSAPVREVEGVDVGPETATPQDLTLEGSGTVSGAFTNPDGAPTTNIPVQITSRDGSETYYTTTNSTGQYTATVAPGEYVVAPLGNNAGNGSQEVSVARGETISQSVRLDPQPVETSASLSIASGPGSVTANGHEMVVIPEVTDGLLQIQIANASDPNRNTSVVQDPSELEAFDVTDDTVFEIRVTVTNYTPHTLFWALRDAEFSAQRNATNPAATDITITGSPVSLATTSSQKKRVGPLVSEDPSTVSWPSGASDTADTRYNQTVYFSIYDLSTRPDSLRERLTGLVLSTNAQRISLPAVSNDRLRTWIAGPRYATADGTVYEGFYQAQIPQSQLEAWGVADHPEHKLFGEYKSSDRELTVESTDDGISVDVSNISYSASYVDIKADADAPVPGEPQGGDEESVEEEPPSVGDDTESADTSDDGNGDEEPPSVGDDTESADTSDDGSGDEEPQSSTDESSSAGTSSGVGGDAGTGGSGSGGGSGGGGSDSAGGAVGVLLASLTAPVRWFGSLSTAGKAAVTVTGGAGAAGAAYSFGGDRIQTPMNMARRRLQSWLRRRLRGSTRQQLTRLVTTLRKRLAWSNIRARLAALRKYFTRSYWREWFESRRELATREGLQAFLVGTYRSYRKRQWRGWLRSRLRGGVDAASGGLVTTLIPSWLAPVSGPVGAALSVVVAEIQRWIEDIVMGKFDALGKRYSTLMLRSGALFTDTTDRFWYAVTGENPPASNSSVSSIAGEHAGALREVGIESVGQLASADPNHLENAVAVAPAVIDKWIEQADRRETKSDRPPIAETVNGRRIRQRVDRVTARVATASKTILIRTAETAELGVRLLRTRTAVAPTWLRKDALPTIIASAQRTRTAVRQRTFEQAERVRPTLRQFIILINDQLVTTDNGLRSIDGIGPAYSERLSDAGLTTVDELARSDPERVAVSIGVSPKRVYRWTAQARSAEWIGQRLRRRVAVRLVKTEASVAALRDSDPAPLDLAVN
ncbi:MAG: carboxypeptidase regulatory-like domain-containing protein, partial [Natronomonas sp.]|nr:carboxypeptidase regulatory-like domain-containing protein [Natronomonas sp.]